MKSDFINNDNNKGGISTPPAIRSREEGFKDDAIFILKVDNIEMGILSRKNGEWLFKYSEDFKKHSDIYDRIIGFPDLNKTYKSLYLWPFFQIRIPGLKQPAIREILQKEHIDVNDEVALLRRFW